MVERRKFKEIKVRAIERRKETTRKGRQERGEEEEEQEAVGTVGRPLMEQAWKKVGKEFLKYGEERRAT